MIDYHYTVDGFVEPISDEPDDFDCDTCQDSDCEICMRIAIEKSLSRSSIGNLDKGFDFSEN